LGTKKRKVNLDNIQAQNTWMLFFRPHLASLLTLSLMAIAKNAPDGGFVHNLPGAAKRRLGDDLSGKGIKMMLTLYRLVEPFVTMTPEEAGER
jgi:hypothetical protein